MSATFLVFLLCGQPVYVFLDTHKDMTLYAVGSMPPDRKEAFLDAMNNLVEEGQADRRDFKVEDQTKEKVCGIST